MTRVAAILAGGEGKRLWPLSNYIQKTMIPLGPEEKPLLEYIVMLLKKHDFKDIVMLVGYRANQILNYFGDGSRFGVRISYSYDDDSYRGSAGALLKAYRSGLFDKTEDVLVYYGDILGDFDLSGMYTFHKSRSADATLLVTEKYNVPVGIVRIDGERIVELNEKPWLNLNATIGVSVIKKEVLALIGDIHNRSTDLMGDFIPYLIKNNKLVVSFKHTEKWYDIGSIERYEKLDGEWIKELHAKLFSKGEHAN